MPNRKYKFFNLNLDRNKVLKRTGGAIVRDRRAASVGTSCCIFIKGSNLLDLRFSGNIVQTGKSILIENKGNDQAYSCSRDWRLAAS